MDGKSRKFDPGKGVVNTPLCATDRTQSPFVVHLDDQEEWEIPVLMGKVHAGTKHIARNLLLVAQSSSVERWGALGLVCSLRRKTGIQLGRSQIRAGSVGRPIGFLGMFCLVNSRHLLVLSRKKSHWRPQRAPGNPKSRVFFFLWLRAVGGASKPADISSFSAEVTTPSPCPLRNLTSTPESYQVTLSDPSLVGSEGIKGKRSRNSSPAMSRKSSVVSWSGQPCEQLEALYAQLSVGTC